MTKPHLVMLPDFMCDERLFVAQCDALCGLCQPQVMLPPHDARR